MAARIDSLKGDRAFQRLRKGRSGGARHLGVRWRPSRQEGIRVGIVVSRKVGNAVVRNRVRRRLREALRDLVACARAGDGGGPPLASAGADLLILTRPEAATADYRRLHASLERALHRSGFL